MYKKIHLYAIAFIGLIITFCTIYNIFNNNHILDAGNLFLLLLYVCFAGAYVLMSSVISSDSTVCRPGRI